MGFERTWDSSCPRVWDSWEVNGTPWVIQDLAPEDDETAIQILMEYFVPDEVLSALSNFSEDLISIQSLKNFWRECLAKRMTLACYTEAEGKKILVGLNVCVVDNSKDRIPHIEVDGEAFKNVVNAVMYIDNKCDAFKYLGCDVLLHAFGLTVRKAYRGLKLGSRLLSARTPLSLEHGIKGTSSVFTGHSSPKSAERSGFKTICEVSLKELSENGMNYPLDEDRVIKLMVKSFV